MAFVHILLLGLFVSGPPPQFDKPESCITALYDYVSVDAGESYDWSKVESCFIETPVIVLRTSRDSSTIMTLEDFINDFKTFVERANISASGFKETIINMKAFEIGNVASFHVIYEAMIPGSDREPLRGVDMIHLVKTVQGWKISSIVNDILYPKDTPVEMKEIPL